MLETAVSEAPQSHPIVRAILNFLSEVWSFVLFSLFSAPVRGEHRSEEPRDTSVTSIERHATTVDTPLERSRPERHLESRTHEGGWRSAPRGIDSDGLEDDVSDEFLSQLEQRTQQVKITLANLEAEKVRIEGMIAQLQPIVPHYDALLAAERQISEADIALEGDANDAPPVNAGWTQDEPPPEPTDADHQPEESGNSGWSGSWNS